jgi:hypothetical protein
MQDSFLRMQVYDEKDIYVNPSWLKAIRYLEKHCSKTGYCELIVLTQ